MNTIQIPLKGKNGEGKFLLVDAADAELVSQVSWYIEPGNGSYFKIRGKYKGRKWNIGRFILNVQGDDTYHVDHVNHNVLDNRRENLRLVHRDENNRYRRKHTRNSTGFKGVTPHPKKPGKFIAQIETRVNGKRKCYNLDTYDTAEEAARAYDAKCKELQGAFALLNFPESAT